MYLAISNKVDSKRIKRPLFVFGFLLLTQYHFAAMGSNYQDIGVPVARLFKSSEHLGGAQNWTFLQTKNGLIYNGMSSGISEWDGENWRQYLTPDDTRVRALLEWKDGRIYAGTVNNFGYFAANQQGELQFVSLLQDWSFEQRQIGDVWRMAATEHGVVFSAEHTMYFWDGVKIYTIISMGDKTLKNRELFSFQDGIIFKRFGDESVYKLVTFSPDTNKAPEIVDTGLRLPADATLSQAILNQKNELVLMTYRNGIYVQQDDEMSKIVDATVFHPDASMYRAIQARDGFYYAISLDHGLYIFDPSLQAVRRYQSQHNLDTQTLYGLMEDRHGNIWLCGRGTIVKMVSPHKYSVFQSETDTQGAENLGVLQGKVTMAGEGILSVTRPDDNLAPAYLNNRKPTDRYSWHFIEFEEHLFYSEDLGIYAVPIMEPKSNPEHVIEAENGRMFAIDPVSNSLFALTYDGLYRISRKNNTWHHKLIEGTFDRLDRIVIDKNGTIWAGTATQELYRITNAQSDELETKIEKFDGKNGLPVNNVFPFKLDNELAIGTDNGWLEYRKTSSPQFKHKQGLPEVFSKTGNALYRLYQDQKERVWFQLDSDNGFLYFDNGWKMHSRIFDAFGDVSFNGFVHTDDGAIWMSNSLGTLFRADIERLSKIPTVGKLNLRQIQDIASGDVLYGGAEMVNLPELNQQQNSLRLSYALTENIFGQETQYRTKLIGGQNEQWSRWSLEAQKDFTDLRGGDYQFAIEAKDGYGRIQNLVLPFSVKPPWFLSSIAWFIYALVTILLLVATGWLTQRWRTKALKARNILLEETVAQRTAEVNAKVDEMRQQQVLKDRFFANVNHEFRTPLTLTIGPLKTLLETNLNKAELDPQNKSLVNTALKNATKILALVGQVLDVNRLESGRLPLRVSEYDLAKLLLELSERFKQWAAQEQQQIICEVGNDPLMLYFDLDQIEKCVSNLVSNAIKYSGKGSLIRISLEIQPNHVTISVKDNGVGISKEDRAKVFERFYQAESSEHLSTPGTGIGLALVKELIKLHSGEVHLESNEGYGSRFRLKLLKGKTHFSNEQLVEPIELSKSKALPFVTQVTASANTSKKSDNNEDKTTLLVVDDNAELRHFMIMNLSASFNIIEAENGKLAFAAACEYLPDLIISDVMMPIMTGLELVEQLRSTPATHTIPVILLTAKSSKRETVEGFNVGADDYLTKPFDTSELIMRVTALLNARKMIRQSIEFETSLVKLQIEQKSDFSQQLVSVVEQHLTDPEFGVELLASMLHMSRETLSRKCKKELKQSPMTFITQIRMHHACILLQQNTLNISEIGYALGFESLSYFSRSFKKHTGHAPSDYVKSLH